MLLKPPWPYHFRSKRLGLVLKILVLVLLPVLLVLWPVVGVVVSLLGGIGYGFFSPLLATFEAVGENIPDKFYHCFVVCSLSPWLYLFLLQVALFSYFLCN